MGKCIENIKGVKFYFENINIKTHATVHSHSLFYL